jgi:hypothetical protein
MPRKIRDPDDAPRVRPSALAPELAEELRSHREFGQPIIDEEHFKTGAIRVSVLWDRWDGVASEDRGAAIIQAYRMVEGAEFARRIALAGGMTFPEAHASGMLPFQVIAALRRDDPVTPDQCRQAMIDEGASTLLDPNRPQLWFATEDEAEASLKRLALRLPGSEQIWQIMQEVGQSVGLSWDAMN